MLSVLLAVLIGCVAMVARDAAGEFQAIAQTRGNAKLAAMLGPISTLTGILVQVVGAGSVILHGITPRGVAVIGGLLVTDTFDGYVFTRLGRRIKAD